VEMIWTRVYIHPNARNKTRGMLAERFVVETVDGWYEIENGIGWLGKEPYRGSKFGLTELLPGGEFEVTCGLNNIPKFGYRSGSSAAPYTPPATPPPLHTQTTTSHPRSASSSTPSPGLSTQRTVPSVAPQRRTTASSGLNIGQRLFLALIGIGAAWFIWTAMFNSGTGNSTPSNRGPVSAFSPGSAKPTTSASKNNSLPPTSSAEKWVTVANTENQGVYIRQTPKLNDRLTAWPDGTRFKLIGPDTTGDGAAWKHVESPNGQQGWVPAQYVVPSP
jgi:hypothetical protein